MRVVLWISLFALAASPASAEFTGRELAALKKVLDAFLIDHYNAALHFRDIIEFGTTASTRTAINGLIKDLRFIDAQRHSALGLYIGVAPPGFDAGRPREEWARTALSKLGASSTRLDWLIATRIPQLEALDPGLTRFHEELSLTKTYLITEQSRMAAAIALASEEGFLAPKPPQYPKVAGPHGDYDLAQRKLWNSARIVWDAHGFIGEAYPLDALLPEYEHLSEVWFRFFAVAKTEMQYMMLLSGVARGVEERADDSLRRMFRVFLALLALHGPTYNYRSIEIDHFGPMVPYLGARPNFATKWGNVVSRVSSSWKDLDDFFREALNIPKLKIAFP